MCAAWHTLCIDQQQGRYIHEIVLHSYAALFHVLYGMYKVQQLGVYNYNKVEGMWQSSQSHIQHQSKVWSSLTGVVHVANFRDPAKFPCVGLQQTTESKCCFYLLVLYHSSCFKHSTIIPVPKKEKVRLGRITSSTVKISTSSFQGCVLSPQLFSL